MFARVLSFRRIRRTNHGRNLIRVKHLEDPIDRVVQIKLAGDEIASFGFKKWFEFQGIFN